MFVKMIKTTLLALATVIIAGIGLTLRVPPACLDLGFGLMVIASVLGDLVPSWDLQE